MVVFVPNIKDTSVILQKANEEKWNFPKNTIEAKDIFSTRSDTKLSCKNCGDS